MNEKTTKYLNALPDNVPEINLSHADLIELPDLSRFTHVQYLWCSNNQLTSLPDNLPNSLQELNCNNNQLTSLPPLPTSLQKIYGVILIN